MKIDLRIRLKYSEQLRVLDLKKSMSGMLGKKLAEISKNANMGVK